MKYYGIKVKFVCVGEIRKDDASKTCDSVSLGVVIASIMSAGVASKLRKNNLYIGSKK